MEQSQIANFYSGRCVLITGATGFMGKVLVEKLLRSCSEINTIYLLIRSKGSLDVSSRLQQMLSSKLFDNLRQSTPEVLNKLVAVEGDITLPALGLSAEDTETLAANVSVVFHSAATIKFDEKLKLALIMNVLGTVRMVELCHKMEKLVSLIHISTAYCNCDRNEIKEIIYPSPADPYKLIQLVDWMDDDIFQHLTPMLIGKRPNTYTYTKALAEHVLVKEAGSLPITIIRPSIVCAAWREPISGWVDNMNGPTGILLAAGKGSVRTLHCKEELVADIIPVDIAINLIIVSAWHTATHRTEHVKVFNCVSGMEKPLLWKEVNEFCMKSFKDNVLNDVIWYPKFAYSRHSAVFNIEFIFKQLIPAYFFDTIVRLTGKKPIMIRLMQKLKRAADSLEYFTMNEWKFRNDNVLALWSTISEADQRAFNFSLSQIDWANYMHQYCLGMKRYVLKEELSTIPVARKHLSKMWWLQQAFRTLMVLVAWRLVMMRSARALNAYAALLRMLLRMATYLPFLNRI